MNILQRIWYTSDNVLLLLYLLTVELHYAGVIGWVLVAVALAMVSVDILLAAAER